MFCQVELAFLLCLLFAFLAGLRASQGTLVWQSPQPVAMAKALRAIIHENADVKKAKEVFDDAVNSK